MSVDHSFVGSESDATCETESGNIYQNYQTDEYPEKLEPGVTFCNSDPFLDKATVQECPVRLSGVSSRNFRRFSSMPKSSPEDQYLEPVGLEPGINPRTTTVQLDDSVGSEIRIIDYSESNIQIQGFDISNPDYVQGQSMLETHLVTRPEWAKLRWIHVNGLSWEAVDPIARFYDLHPLSIEDTLDIPQQPKMENFPGYMYFCFPLHILTAQKERPSQFQKIKSFFTNRCRKAMSGHDSDKHSSRPYQSNSWDKESISSSEATTSKVAEKLQAKEPRSIYQWDRSSAYGSYYQHQMLKKTPREYQMQTVSIEQVSIFMTPSTVITFFERSGGRVADPIIQRVLSQSTMIRASNDSTVLVQAIIDTCVDHIRPIIHEYRGRIYRLQVEAVLHPTMQLTRALHLIKTDLTVLTNTITPIFSLLRSFQARAKTLRGHSNHSEHFPGPPDCEADHYFNDVIDHADCHSNNLKQMMRHVDSIATLIFNTISIRSSDAVKLLSLVTVVFLPLTFLSGYFGMNFTDFDSLHNGLGYYWSLAAPCSAGLILVLMYDTFLDFFLRLCRRSRGILPTAASS